MGHGPEAGMWEQRDWQLVEAVVRSARSGADRLTYDHRWWFGETGVTEEPMPPVLVVEGIRLFHDRSRGWFDLSVWIDLDPDAAGARAKARNVLQGDDRAELDLWDTKWIPEGHLYEQVARPREHADLVLPAQQSDPITPAGGPGSDLGPRTLPGCPRRRETRR